MFLSIFVSVSNLAALILPPIIFFDTYLFNPLFKRCAKVRMMLLVWCCDIGGSFSRWSFRRDITSSFPMICDDNLLVVSFSTWVSSERLSVYVFDIDQFPYKLL